MVNDKNEFLRFLGKCNRSKKVANENTTNELRNYLADYALQIVSSKYDSHHIITEKEIDGDKINVIAKDDGFRRNHIFYMEFGTGIRGEVSGYQGELPTQTFTFTSSKYGFAQTNGWQYYYAYKQGLVDRAGNPATIYEGKPSQGQMYESSVEIRRDYVQKAKDFIEGEVK